MKRVVVVGAGIAGLTTAFELRDAARDRFGVTVLEAADRPGGNLRTEHADGYICEWGPNGFLGNAPDTLALVDRLGLTARLLVSNDASRRRFLYQRGRLRQLPDGPVSFLTSNVLSLAGRLRVLGEPLARQRRGCDETIHAFAVRRIGREAADVLIDPMVSGIFAGDSRALSLRACFPKLWRMEAEHGGLVRAMLATLRRRPSGTNPMSRRRGRLTSFVGGVQELVDALAHSTGAALRTGVCASSVVRSPSPGSRWRVITASGESLQADVVVLAGSGSSSARIVRDLDPELAAAFRSIPCAPLVVVALGYDRPTLGHPLDGFGFLAPSREGLPILGAVWDSSVYSNRAPRDAALVRVMLGGAREPSVVNRSDDELLVAARAGLRQAMGITAAPRWTRVIRHPGGIPQYTVGHLDRLAAIEERLAEHPGIFITGNSYRGVSINSCITDAFAVAQRVVGTGACTSTQGSPRERSSLIASPS
jgi:oxygen-dependent protoporphyrinogen oxidase